MSLFKKILVPTDFSENASSVFGYVRHLAETNDSEVDLVHVIPRLSYLDFTRGVLGNPFKINDGELKEKLVAKLKEEMETQIPMLNRGRVYIIDGMKVAEGIAEQEQEKNYGMIVIGSRGRDNSTDKRGSVTERLIRLSYAPVLSFNKEIEMNMKTILVPTDGSMVSMEALAPAFEFAKRYNASVILYSVYEFDFDRIKMMGGDVHLCELAAKTQQQEILVNLEKYIVDSEFFKFNTILSESGANIDLGGGKIVPLRIVTEYKVSAHDAIVDYANKNADLVAITTHGRSGLAKLLIGSVAEKVIRHLDIPVLTIKPEFARK